LGTYESEIVFVDIFASTGIVLAKIRLSKYFCGEYHSRCVHACPELDLIARPGSYNDNGDVGLFCRLNCFIEPGFIIAPTFASLSIVDCCFIANCGFDTI
jgi:hypothetical protein